MQLRLAAHSASGASGPPHLRLHVRTFGHALRRALSRPLEAPREHDLINLSVTNKHWLQSLKKIYGCLAFGAPRAGVCFLVDSDSLVLRNGLCHAASAYLVRPHAQFFGGHNCVTLSGRMPTLKKTT